MPKKMQRKFNVKSLKLSKYDMKKSSFFFEIGD